VEAVVIRRGLLLSAWPEPDRIAWGEAIAEGDILDGQGPAARWAETTRSAVIAAYGRWLGFVAESEPFALADHPVKRLTSDRLLRYLDHLALTVGTVGRWAYFAHLRDAVRVMFPGETPLILSRLVSRLERECQPRCKAARVVTTQRLTVLSKNLMKQAVGSEGEVVDAVAFRDGLMIGFLAWRPLRRRTFSLIRLYPHLRLVGVEWRMIFEGAETKSGRPLAVSIPKWIVPFLERYLRDVRPMFWGANQHEGLWASTKGCPLTDKAIYRIITDCTHTAFGHPVNPHLFRSCAATTIAILYPNRIGIARDLLGHVSLATTHAYYNKARSIEASRFYAKILAGLFRENEGDRVGRISTASTRRQSFENESL
jgi:integrase/recombinase XerD